MLRAYAATSRFRAFRRFADTLLHVTASCSVDDVTLFTARFSFTMRHACFTLRLIRCFIDSCLLPP